jgi:hypothetical protein
MGSSVDSRRIDNVLRRHRGDLLADLRAVTAVQNNRFPIKQPLQGKALGQKESVNENEVWVS